MAYNNKNRKLKAEETKQKIYKSAEKLFSDNDYTKVSVDEIVKEAGVAKGSFYVHFASKDDLIAKLITDIVKKVDSSYRAFLDQFPDDASAETILLAFVGAIADELNDVIGCSKMKALYKAQIAKDVDTNSVNSYSREIYQMFNQIILKGIKNGEFKKDFPSEMLARSFMIAFRGLTYEWCIRYPDFDLKNQAIGLFEVLLSGIKTGK